MPNQHDRLIRARTLAGYHSAAEAADAMGIGHSTYHNHENGTRGFDRSADRYARFFKVSLEWLMTGRGDPKLKTLDARANALSPMAQEELRRYLDYLETRDIQSRAG